MVHIRECTALRTENGSERPRSVAFASVTLCLCVKRFHHKGAYARTQGHKEHPDGLA